MAVLTLSAIVWARFVTQHKQSPAVAKFRNEAKERIRASLATRAAATEVQSAQSPSGQTPPASELPGAAIAAFKSALGKDTLLHQNKHWDDIQTELQNKSALEWTEEDWAKAKAVLGETRELILELRKLAAMGGPFYELDYSKGFKLELPHLSKLREFSRLLAEDAAMQGHEGNYGEASEDILAILGLGRGLNDEPILISQLVRIVVSGIGCATADISLPEEGLPPEVARSLIDAAGQASYRAAFADSLSGEGGFGLDVFEQLRNGNTDAAPLGTTSGWENVGLQLYGSVLARPWLNMDEEAYAETMARIQEAARLAYYEARPIMDEINQDVRDLPRTRVFSRMLLPALTHAIEAQARNEAWLDLMCLGLSVEQYHDRTGAYPASLDAVASYVGGRVPVDPFTGTSYHYEPSGSGFLLYSVGRNLVDDGGRQSIRDGDMVWRGQEPKVN